MIRPLRCNQFCNGIWFERGLPPTHFPCSVACVSSASTPVLPMHHENRPNYIKIMQHLLLAFYLESDVLAHSTNSNKMRKTKASWERYVQNLLRASPSRNENIKIHSIRSDGYGENHLTCSCSGSSTCYNWRSVSLETHLVTFYILFDRVSALDSSWRFGVFFFLRFVPRLDVHFRYSFNQNKCFSLQWKCRWICAAIPYHRSPSPKEKRAPSRIPLAVRSQITHASL